MQSKTISDLKDILLLEMERRGYSYFSLLHVDEEAHRIECFQRDNRIADIREALSKYRQFLKEDAAKRNLRCANRGVLTTVGRLEDINEGRSITWRQDRRPKILLSTKYETIVKRMKTDESVTGPKKQNRGISRARSFFAWLEKEGVKDLSSLTKEQVLEYYKGASIAARYSGPSMVRYTLKMVLEYLYKYGYTEEDFSSLLTMSIKSSHRLLPPADPVDVRQMLGRIDRKTAVGKRDYAILMLAIATGLRAGDIARLTFSSIDWKNGLISVQQNKTQQSINLPLTKDVAIALLDYINNGRPHIRSDDFIFLSHVAPFEKMSPRAIPSVYKKLRNLLAEENGIIVNSSFHALRRLYVTNLIRGGVPLPVVSRMAGHVSMSSTEKYLSFDEESLHFCPIPLSRTYLKEEK